MSTEYTKTNWQDGDIITADKMNNIENGIKDVEEATTHVKDDLTAAQVELAKKANTDGYYEEMTVGNAEQLVSTVTNADDTPYNFRTTAGSVDVGDRAYVDAIVGGTLNVNQLVQNGNFADVSVWSTYSSNYTVSNNVATIEHLDANGFIYQPITSVSAHKYLISVDVRSDTITSGFLYWNSTSFRNNAITPTWGNIATVFNSMGSGTNLSFRFNTNGGSVTGQLRKFMVSDLTATFGSTIADYIYSLETATAGAGVAWLKANAPKIFNGEYIPFNAGTLQSVVGLSEKRNTGFNQFDKSTVVKGRIDNGSVGYAFDVSELTITETGIRFTTSNGYRGCTSDYFRVIPKAAYFISMTPSLSDVVPYVDEYDAEKKWIRRNTLVGQYYATIHENAKYARLSFQKVSAGTVSINDICINLHWDGEKDGTYEPYTVHTYAFDPTVELRGVPKLKDGKMYFDGDRYLPDGTVQRRYGVVDLGTLNWTKYAEATNIPVFYASNDIPGLKPGSGDNVVCDRYVCRAWSSLGSRIDKCVEIHPTIARPYISDSSYTDPASFKAAVSGVMLIYELATPTTETAEPYQQTQICDPNGTEEYISETVVPVGHVTRYPENLRKKIEELPWNFATLIAPTEATFKATRNYTTRSLFIVNNVLYKATANIANGATITPNSNCTATTLAEVISALS